MDVKTILSYIPESQLEYLSIKTAVDHQVKKLSGSFVFRLLLFSLLTTRKSSLRIIEEACNSILFKGYIEDHKGFKYNSLSMRLRNIESDFFKELYEFCIRRFSSILGNSSNLMFVDSTLVALSSKLLDKGMEMGARGDKKFVKFSMILKDIPVHCEVFTNQQLISEDLALSKVILNCPSSSENIVVFDRGLAKRRTFDEFSEKEIQFVTRANLSLSYQQVASHKVTPECQNAGIQEDLTVQLFCGNKKKTKACFRLIKAEFNGEKLFFITNIFSLSSLEITEIYKKRWDIETFFKFIKQELNFSHFISRNENGIKVMMYMTLITSTLLAVYKKLNNLDGFKIPKLKFANQLEASIIEKIVILCGGDPNKFSGFNST